MKFLELNCEIGSVSVYNEIVIAYLSTVGFSMFQENKSGLKAYILKEDFDESSFLELPIHKSTFETQFKWSIADADDQNWNAKWESSFEPVIIRDKVAIRAQHHQPVDGVDHELIITPRMSFGTGHHATTSLMVEAILDYSFADKNVLDMGSGTGILGMVASRLGAKSVDGVDIDENATENAIENLRVNGITNMNVVTGNAHTNVGNIYDFVLANINRNIILEDLSLYAEYLTVDGVLLLSGFYHSDLDKIKHEAHQQGFKYLKHSIQNDWCCARFQKI